MNSRTEHPHVVIIQNTELGSHLPLSVYLTGLVNRFVQLKDAPHVIVSSVFPETGAILDGKNNFQTHTNLYSVFGNVVFGFKALRFLFAINRIKKVNIIHALYPSSSLFAGVLFKFFHWDVKILYDVRSPWIEMAIEREYIPKIFQKIFLWTAYAFEWLLTRYVKHFVFISKGLRDYYFNRLLIKKEEASVIPSGVDLQNFTFNPELLLKKQLGFPENAKIIGYVGGLASERKLEFLIQAFSFLSKKNSDYYLLIVGDGPAKSMLEKMAQNFGLSAKIIFTGNIEHAAVPQHICIFDIGVCHLPDSFIYRQSFPLKILEYAACGIPIVASDVLAHREIQKELDGVWLYTMTPESFVTAVKSATIAVPFLGNKEKLRNTYDWSALSKHYLELYESV